MRMNWTVFIKPSVTMAEGPAFTRAAPTRPPMSACEELVGRPRYQVVMFQPIAPTRQERMMLTFSDRRCDAGVHREGGDEVEERGPGYSLVGLEDAGRNDGGNGVGRVVEPVAVVEDQRQDHHEDDQQKQRGHQEYLSWIVSRVLETSSHLSMAISRRS
jgi:hypothetical protein